MGALDVRRWTQRASLGRGHAVAVGVALAAVVVLAGCSRSGTLMGDVAVRTPSGETVRGDRIGVLLVPASEAFEREWADVVAAFRKDVAPAAEAQKAAEYRADEARRAWDRALTARGKDGARRGRYTLSLRGTDGNGSQPLWRNVRATEAAAFQARKRVWEIVRKHEADAQALIARHATQQVQTDETGHYVIVKVPIGKVYVYARLSAKKTDFVWCVPIQVQSGTQQANLTSENQRAWQLTP